MNIDLFHRLKSRYQKEKAWRRGRNVIRNKSGSTLKVAYNISGHNNKIDIDNDVKGKLRIDIAGNDNLISISQGVIFYGSTIVNMYSSNNSELSIGKKTTTQGSTFYFIEPNTKIAIGADCLFAGQTGFWCTDFHSIIDANSLEKINHPKSIMIEDHVWIGWGAKVLKNVTIGSNTIVSVNSTVTKSLPAGCIAMGVPAKPVKSDISWNISPNYEKPEYYRKKT